MPLQWGRSDDGAEDVGTAATARTFLHRFNGAAPMTERKTTDSVHQFLALLKLQWGRSDDGAEDDRSLLCPHPHSSCFNGAAPMTERKTFEADLQLFA